MHNDTSDSILCRLIYPDLCINKTAYTTSVSRPRSGITSKSRGWRRAEVGRGQWASFCWRSVCLVPINLLESVKTCLQETRDKFSEYEFKDRSVCLDRDYADGKSWHKNEVCVLVDMMNQQKRYFAVDPKSFYSEHWTDKRCRGLFTDWKSVGFFFL